MIADATGHGRQVSVHPLRLEVALVFFKGLQKTQANFILSPSDILAYANQIGF